MSDYIAPLRDMHFILEELAEIDAIARLPGCEEASVDLVWAILEEAGKFAAEVLAPINRPGDVQGCRLEGGRVTMPEGWKEAYEQFRNAGWIGLSLPTEYGGQDLPKVVSTAVVEMWFSTNLAFTILPLLNMHQAEALLIAASGELKRTWLPKVVSGEWGCSMNLTEPQAGSDLGGVRMRAEPHNDGSFRLFGQKIFISYGEHDLTNNILHLVLARLPDAPPGVKGLSLFLVPKFLLDARGEPGQRNDIHCVSIEHKLGIRGSPTCTLVYGDGGGAVGWMVGAPNRGLETMFIMMNEARFGVGVQGVGLGERAYQFALAYARERVQGRHAITGESGMPIVHHPDVKRMLLSMRSRVMAMRAMLYTAAGWFDLAKHHPDPTVADKYRRFVDVLMPVAKGWCTEVGNDVCDEAIQVFGGMGFIEETGIAQFLRDARITRIYEGTTGIQGNDLIGRKILRENGKTLRELLSEMRDTERLLVASEDRLGFLGSRLRVQIDALEQTLQWVLTRDGDDLEEVFAGAVPFLFLVGVVVASWQLGRAAMAANRRLQAGVSDLAYFSGIIEMARYFTLDTGDQAIFLSRKVQEAGGVVVVFPHDAF